MTERFAAKIVQSPQTPGVYLFKDPVGNILYVGKSVNIHQRLLQHAASLKAGWGDRNHRKVHQVADIEWQETDSELFALLLEDQLIKQHWPWGNVRQKDFLEYAYLSFTTEAFPRLLVLEARQRDQHQPSYGPFRNIYYAQDMADLITDRFRLRTCSSPKEGGCLQKEIRKCLGPCCGAPAAGRYARLVDLAKASLCAFDPAFMRFMKKKMQAHALKHEFEKAAHYHHLQHRYAGYLKRQKFHDRFRRHGLMIWEKGHWSNTFLFVGGRLVERNGQAVSVWPFPDQEWDERVAQEWRVVDRANVIYQWLASQRSEAEAVFLDARFLPAGSTGSCSFMRNRLTG